MSTGTRVGGEQGVALAEALVNGTDEAMILVSGDSVVAVRDGFPLNEELGLTLDDVLADLDAYIEPADQRILEAAWSNVVEAPGNVESVSFTLRDVRGQAVLIEATASNLRDTTMKAILARLRISKVSMLPPPPPPSDSNWPDDPLMHKPEFMELVQRAVDRKVNRVWKRPRHMADPKRERRYDYALVLLNLDRYGMLRGSFGEKQLAALMRQAAERIRRALRARDAVAVMGRSELAMYLDGIPDSEQAARVTDAYTRILEDRFEVDNESVTLSPIVGIATSERRYDDAQDLIRDAAAAVSLAMRRARTGRQAYKSAIRIEDRRRLVLSADLRDGLATEQLYVEYQPIVDLATGDLVGFEALCRWDHPTLERVGPNEFIPVAEEVGLIRKLGTHVLKSACVQAARWNKDRLEPVYVSVNVSAAEIVHSTFAHDVMTVIEDSGMEAEHLTLEVTESALLEDIEAAKANMLELRLRGVQFALDDFGTGYASLAYLVDLPFNRLKIDRSLVANEDDAHRRKVVRAVIALGHELGLAIVAEGIETAAQVKELTSKGCDYGQGWLYGASMRPEVAGELIGDV